MIEILHQVVAARNKRVSSTPMLIPTGGPVFIRRPWVLPTKGPAATTRRRRCHRSGRLSAPKRNQRERVRTPEAYKTCMLARKPDTCCARCRAASERARLWQVQIQCHPPDAEINE